MSALVINFNLRDFHFVFCDFNPITMGHPCEFRDTFKIKVLTDR